MTHSSFFISEEAFERTLFSALLKNFGTVNQKLTLITLQTSVLITRGAIIFARNANEFRVNIVSKGTLRAGWKTERFILVIHISSK